MKINKFLKAAKIVTNVLIPLTAIMVVVKEITFANASAINDFLHISTQKIIDDGTQEKNIFYDSKYKTVDELRKSSEQIIEEVMGEGITLLKNDNTALPLSKGNSISLYGASSVDLVITGGGSSGSNTKIVKKAINLKDGLSESGLSINEDLWNFYKDNPKYYQKGKMGNDASGNQNQVGYYEGYYTIDASWEEMPESKNNQADAAIMVLSRTGGENIDLFRNKEEVVAGNKSVDEVSKTMSSFDYLRLSDNESSVLKGLKALKDNGTIGKIIVLMNSANQIQTDFVDDPTYGIDSLLWMGTASSVGTRALGKILVGDINPSGHLSDTFWYDHSKNPVYANFGNIAYKNSNELNKYRNGENQRYTVYQEGIYNGYRYSETRYEDSTLKGDTSFKYNKYVSYPFGYGLSYTTFSYSNMNVDVLTENNETIYSVSVDVKNDGFVPGKGVAELYIQKPYTSYDVQYKVEKASVELCGYEKTKLLEPGESQTLTINVKEKELASYDSNYAQTYVIGSNNPSDLYRFAIGKDAHDAINNILASKGQSPSSSNCMDGKGNEDLVWSTYIDFSDTKYYSNAFIDNALENSKERYDGDDINFGVAFITNQFDKVDFQKYSGFEAEERNQPYVSRNDFESTTYKTISLTASSKLANDQKTYQLSKDNVPYPTYGASNNLKLLDLRNDEEGNLRPYNDPLWDKLLDQMSFEETVNLLKDGLRATQTVPSVVASKTFEQNGASGPVQAYGSNSSGSTFEGWASYYQSGVGEYPSIFPCNGIVASTFNKFLIEKLGEQLGEECSWAGYNGIYGLGINLHRGAYNGRAFEYYSEDPYLTGISSGYESKGIQSKGVFVILKHAVLNEQESYRYGICSWANEQTIRELYLKPIQICIDTGDELGMLGIMTGLNRLGAVWSGAQGFTNTVLRAEFGMNGYIISDFFQNYMSPANGLMAGSDLPDGTTGAGANVSETKDGISTDLNQYKDGYGEFAWAMRESAHRVLYTVARSNVLNFTSSGMKIEIITPSWQKAVKAGEITLIVLVSISVTSLIILVVLDKTNILKKRSNKQL